MLIAKIVGSNTHIDYVGRIIDSLDSRDPPADSDYGFGQFVRVNSAAASCVGVIYDSRLINPEYSNFGPRLSPKPSLANFSPDYLNEQGVLIGILILGINDGSGPVHGVPRGVLPAGSDVETLEVDTVKRFHSDARGRLQLHYYSQVMQHSGAFAVPLLESIIDQLSAGSDPTDSQRLLVLRRSLAWQRTFGNTRL